MPPRNITEGVEAIKKIDGVTVLEQPFQYHNNARWIIKVRLHPDDIEQNSQVPRKTDWYVHLQETYPAGSIGIYPAQQQENTLTATFAHQRLNVEGNEDAPWRTGDICVARYGHTLNQTGATGEPTTVRDRLHWHMERALIWVTKASRGELREPGEPFEIPAFNTRTAPNRTLAFNETRDSFKIWSTAYGQWGTVTLSQLPTPKETYATHEFSTSDGAVLYQSDWGDYIETATDDQFLGAWMLLEEPPFEPPWEAPETWQDLQALLDGTEINLWELRADIKPLLEGKQPKLLLIGFPIPEVVGGDPVLIHWQPVEILEFKDPADVPGGYRETKHGRQRAAQVAKREERIRWLDADNWSHEQLTRRGHMADKLLDRNILLIGAGALGSMAAECLVRAGCRYLTIVDGETCEIGNLARHTLSLDDIGRNKATAVVDRLQTLSPYVRVVDVDTAFPPSGDMHEAVEAADVVIDCTASRAVRYALDDIRWDHPVVFYSAAMGRRANRLFFFSAYSHTFPYSDYNEVFEPWRLQEQVEWDDDEDAVPERVGCWHPASVISMNRVMSWAGKVTELIDRTTGLGLGETDFTVLETPDDEDLPLVLQAAPPFQDVATWQAPDSGATVQVPTKCLNAMYERCTDDHPCETGGILAGTDRSDATALIINARDPPRDSIQEPTRFLRGTAEVDEWLRDARDSIGIGYLGEWHYHPSAPPEITDQDRDAMKEIATDDDYDCPHPLLFIIGQNETDQYAMNAYLFHRDKEYETLRREDTTDTTVEDRNGGKNT